MVMVTPNWTKNIHCSKNQRLLLRLNTFKVISASLLLAPPPKNRVLNNHHYYMNSKYNITQMFDLNMYVCNYEFMFLI